MKYSNNSFSHLGLDPQHLRGIPDELVAKLVKDAFRTLILFYHDDKRVSEDTLSGQERTKKFDRRRDEIVDAYHKLSTPEGRLAALAEYKKSTTTSLKDEVKSSEVFVADALKHLSDRELSLILDRVGALEQTESYCIPIHKLRDGKILTSFASEFHEMGTCYEFTLNQQSTVTNIYKCKFVTAKKVLSPKEQIWFIEGTSQRQDCYAIKNDEIEIPQGLIVIGSISDRTFNGTFNKNLKHLVCCQTSPKPQNKSIPFYRLHSSGMRQIIPMIVPYTFRAQHLVLVDDKGTFYFAGDIRATLTKGQLKSPTKKV
jgi:curved DNA-binding protein CbpA